MADQRGMRRVRLTFIQQGLQPACRPIKEEGFDSVGHVSFYQTAGRKTKTYRRGREARRRARAWKISLWLLPGIADQCNRC